MWPVRYWPTSYWSGEYWPKTGEDVEPVPVSPDCIHDWNIEDVVLEASEIIIQQMTLTRSTSTPTGDNDWTI